MCSTAGFKRFNALKEINPSVKTLVAVGGWNEGSTGFSAVAASSTLRKKFVASAVSLLQTYGFDGFDLDWEYPAQRGGASADKVGNLYFLVKILFIILFSGKFRHINKRIA